MHLTTVKISDDMINEFRFSVQTTPGILLERFLASKTVFYFVEGGVDLVHSIGLRGVWSLYRSFPTGL
jgi:hypothetical protein